LSCHGGTGAHAAHIDDAGLKCSSCHDSDNMPNFADGGTDKDNTGVCEDCHHDGTVVATGTKVLANPPDWDSGLTLDCSGCHGNAPGYANGNPKANSHAAHKFNCYTCHSATTYGNEDIRTPALHNNNEYDVQKPIGGIYQLHGTGSDDIRILDAVFYYAFNGSGGNCLNISCHNGRNATWGGSPLDCQDCHVAAADVDDFEYGNSTLALINETQWLNKGHGRADSTLDCQYCHNPGVMHGDDRNPFRLANTSDPGPAGQNSACLICHRTGASGYDPDGAGPLPAQKSMTAEPVDSYHYGSKHKEIIMDIWDFSGQSTTKKMFQGGRFCWDCHDPHGDDNIKMVQNKLTTLSFGDNGDFGVPYTPYSITTVFDNNITGADFADPDTVQEAERNGVCQVCHTDTLYYSSSQGQNGHYTDTCINCHSHNGEHDNTAFGASCTDCHATSQGNRAAITGQFSGNSHHIQGVEVKNTHCYQCHWEADSEGEMTSNHQGTPGGTVDLVVYGAGIRPDSYQESATAIQYLANGSREEIEKLNSHCLGCHSDQNNTTQPFGDGKTPKNYAWDGTSVDARYSDPGTTAWGKYNGSYVSQKAGITKAFSAHGNAPANQGGYSITKSNGFKTTESWPNTMGGSVKVSCFDCHSSHGSTASGTTTSYAGATTNGGLLKNTIAGKGGYAADYAPASGGSELTRNQYNAGADLCFDCHLTENGGQTPWGYKSTFGATQPVNGLTDFARFGSTGDIRNTHAGGHFGASQPLTTPASGSINGLCTPCHDPHGVSPTISQNYGIPLLKGTWLTSPYKLDKPKYANSEYNRYGTPPYNIDQNTFGNHSESGYRGDSWDFTSTAGISQSVDTFGGLCLKCHPKTSIDRDATTTWRTMDRVHETVKGWGANSKHSFPCAKCHTPHATKLLPRLMITNCLDSKHKGFMRNNLNPIVEWSYSRDCSLDPSGTCNGNGKYPTGGQGDAGKVGFGLGISCHDNVGTGTYPDKNLWNNVTPWLDQDLDESYYYPSNPTSPIRDCDETNANISGALDRTCDGDSDGFIDASAGGTDCDDNNNSIGYQPALCDKDGDAFIDPSFGGYDCDETNASIKASADGSCDGDSDNYIDWTAGGNDCNDTDGGIIPPCDLTGNTTSYTTNTLTDSTADWRANVFAGRVITYHVTETICGYGCTYTEHYSTRTIISNTKTTITVNSNWDFPTGYDAKEYTIRLN
jgi:hypothetical protein